MTCPGLCRYWQNGAATQVLLSSAFPSDNNNNINNGYHLANSVASTLHMEFLLDPFGVGTTFLSMLHTRSRKLISARKWPSHLYTISPLLLSTSPKHCSVISLSSTGDIPVPFYSELTVIWAASVTIQL